MAARCSAVTSDRSFGSLTEMKEKGENESDGANLRPMRKAGMLVAVVASDEAKQDLAVKVLREAGGHECELADGHIALIAIRANRKETNKALQV